MHSKSLVLLLLGLLLCHSTLSIRLRGHASGPAGSESGPAGDESGASGPESGDDSSGASGASGSGSGASGSSGSSGASGSSGSSGASGGAVDTAALAKLLQGLAKKVEGESGASGPAAGLVTAITHSVRIMGRRHAAKLTMHEMITALNAKKQKKKPKVSLSQILDAFRLPPRKPKRKDPKPALLKKVKSMEATIEKLQGMLNGEEKKEEPADESMEEVKSREMLENLPDLKPEESSLPKAIPLPLPPAIAPRK
jgi:hypothetical protein